MLCSLLQYFLAGLSIMFTDFSTRASTRARGPSSPSGIPGIAIASEHTGSNLTAKHPLPQQLLVNTVLDSTLSSSAEERGSNVLDTVVNSHHESDENEKLPKLPTSTLAGVALPVAWGANTSNAAMWPSQSGGGLLSSNRANAPIPLPITTSNGSNNIELIPVTPNIAAPSVSKIDAAEAKHRRFLSTFKVQRCREKVSHVINFIHNDICIMPKLYV